MNYLFIPFFMVFLACFSEPDSKEAIPYFSAIIVSQMDTSIQWYSEKLGFELTDRREIETMGIIQANLKSEGALIELIETSTSLDPAELLSDRPANTRIKGYFKFGFRVSNFESWVSHLKESGARFHGDVVIDKNTGKRMLIVKDPDGNRIQFFEN